MTVAWVLIFKKFKSEGKFYSKVLLPVSKASYGIYLSHLLILVPVCGWFRSHLGLGLDGCLGIWTTPVQIMVSAIVGFVCTTALSVFIRKIPKVGKYIIG